MTPPTRLDLHPLQPSAEVLDRMVTRALWEIRAAETVSSPGNAMLGVLAKVWMLPFAAAVLIGAALGGRRSPAPAGDALQQALGVPIAVAEWGTSGLLPTPADLVSTLRPWYGTP